MTRQARVGLLVLAGTILFLVALFAIANRSFLFFDTFHLKSQFSRVAGLQAGAAVQFQGVNVGRVDNVTLPSEPGGLITVDMAIRESARHLIRKSTQAQIKSDGLVGNMIVVLVNPPAPVAPPIHEDDLLRGVDPFDVFEITDTAMVAVRRFEEAAATLNLIMRDVREGTGTLGKFIYDDALYNTTVATFDETQRLVRGLGNNAEALVALAQNATQGVNSILTKLDQGDGTAAMILNDPGVYNKLLAAADTIESISGDLRAITTSAEQAANWGSLAMFRFAENMTALKHSWLLRRYFEERGYYDRAPIETRERAIAETYQNLEKQQRDLYQRELRLKELERQLEEERAAIEAARDTTSSAVRTGPGPTETSLMSEPASPRE